MIVHGMSARRRSAEDCFCPRAPVALTLGPSQVGSGAVRFGKGPLRPLGAAQTHNERGLS